MNAITNEQVINKLVESEAGRKAASDILREQEAERINLKAQAATLRKQRGAALRELNDAAEAAQQHLEAARKELTEAEREHRAATQAQGQTRAHYTARIERLDRQLLATAPAAIDTFIEWLADQEQACRETEITTHGQKTNRISTHTSELIHEFWTNAEALRERLAAIRNARAEAEGLKDRVMDAGDLQQRLEALRESLPAVEMRLAYER